MPNYSTRINKHVSLRVVQLLLQKPGQNLLQVTHWAAGLSWIDSLVEASMILSGMGPISPLSTTSAKVFASLYALFSGLVFVIAMGIVLSPLVYSLLSQFPVNLKSENHQPDKLKQKDEEVELKNKHL